MNTFLTQNNKVSILILAVFVYVLAVFGLPTTTPFGFADRMLEHFFGSKTRVKLLYIFFHEPDRPFYVRELARLITIQLNAVRRELSNLERFGIIRQVEYEANSPHDFSERSKYYQLERAHVLYRELAAFLSKAQVLEQKAFIDHLLRVAGDVRFCLLTGFFMHLKSPTDILIVGKLAVPAIEKNILAFERDRGAPLHYTLMEESEFKERQSLGDVFLSQLLEAPHSIVVDRLNQK